jgi:CRISPR/Cas system-associated exonuclease Cas4 (RecB family)
MSPRSPGDKLKMSVSSIGSYDKCPKKYWYQYIEKPEIEKQKWDHLELGSYVHLVLEKFHKYIMEQPLPSSEYPSLMKKCAKESLSEFDDKILAKEASMIKSILQSYLDGVKKNGMPNVISVERPFLFDVGDYIIRGFIDRIDRLSDGHYHVVDYKTSKSPSYLTPFQLYVYGLVVKKDFPDAEKITGSYNLLKHDCKYKTWEITDDKIKETHDDIIRFGDSISNNILSDIPWEKKPSKLCDFCDFKDLCQNNWTD